MVTYVGILIYCVMNGILIWRLIKPNPRIRVENIGLIMSSLLLIHILDLPRVVYILFLLFSLGIAAVHLLKKFYESRGE